MHPPYHYVLYNKALELPHDWDRIAGNDLFLTRAYAEISDVNPAQHMNCMYVGVFSKDNLVGIVYLQCIHLSALPHYGTRQHCLRTKVRQWLIHYLAGRLLFVGNNMLTGQHAFAFDASVPSETYAAHLRKAAEVAIDHMTRQGCQPQAVLYKDFPDQGSFAHLSEGMRDLFVTSAQPNMQLLLPAHWKSGADYVADLLKKYRDQYKRARKKAQDIQRIELQTQDLTTWQSTMYAQYKYVADHAVFNTFYLPEDHFVQLKKHWGNQFKVFGYFLNQELIGYCTYFVNKATLDTYFLGYEAEQQKNHLLYLNMLYDMLEDAIHLNSTQIVYSRSALEIKSSVGASPQYLKVFIEHRYKWMQKLLPLIYRRFEPTLTWQLRHPFKSQLHDTVYDHPDQLRSVADR